MTTIIPETYLIGRLFYMNKKVIVETLYLLISSMLHRGNLDYQFRYVTDNIKQEKMAKSLNKKMHRKYLSNQNKYSQNRNNLKSPIPNRQNRG